jgi:hypothetical protein
MLLAFALGAVPHAAAQDTLVHIRHLAPRNVRSAYFALDSAQDVHIAAIGGEAIGRSAVRRFLDHGVFQGKEDRSWDRDAWPANAWILDGQSRRVVWELRSATTQRGDGGLRIFDGTVRLPAGTYEAGYAALFPVSGEWDRDGDWRARDARNDDGIESLHGPYIDDGRYRRFQMVVRGAGRRVTQEGARAEAEKTTLVTLHGTHSRSRERLGFELDRTMKVSVHLEGEKDGAWKDYGWIMDAATREVVWTSRSGSGEPAGGARKNRLVRDALQLPAGKYVAFYVTDDSHHATAWNETPPLDPSSWGLTVRLEEADRRAARTFPYQPLAVAGAFVQLTRLGDDELRWQQFTVGRPMVVNVFAVGEGRRGGMNDFGWIVDASGQAVWRMEYDSTGDGGGAAKNRVSSTRLRLAAGRYTAYFVTDGSHSFDDGWNSEEPLDGEYWGMTIAPADPQRDRDVARAVDDAAGPDDPALLARITRVRTGREEEARFTLPARTVVRIYALGEGTGSMADYAWIEDGNGREVWRMTHQESEPAGGSSKNRRVRHTLTLEAGSYTVRYHTDDSHSWKDWNAAPPDDPLSWGITVTRAGAKS